MNNDVNLEIKITAQTIWGEDRGGAEEGMTAVADVIGNRVAIAQLHIEEYGTPHPLFGDGSFADCCRRPEQFSCWNAGDPNHAKMQAVTISNAYFLTAMRIASQAVIGHLLDSTKGATHYYAVGAPVPAWAKGLDPCAKIGNQLFFNNVK